MFPAVRMASRHPQASLDSCILVFLEAALAADLITAASKFVKNGVKNAKYEIMIYHYVNSHLDAKDEF